MACFWGNLKKTVCREPNNAPFMGAGLNNYGQLGLGHTDPVHAFTPIPLDNVAKMSVGYGFAMVVDGNGVLYGAGRNDYNQLTDSSPPEGVTTFTQIGTNVLDVECGFYGSQALLADGTWRRTGYNRDGSHSVWEPVRLRFQASTGRPVPRMMSDGLSFDGVYPSTPPHKYARRASSGPLDDDDYYLSMLEPSVSGWGMTPSGPQYGTLYSRESAPFESSLTAPVSAIFAGGGETIFCILDGGELYGLYDNGSGQYGIGTKTAGGTASWVYIGSGYGDMRVERQITFAKTLNGVWYAAGRNIYGSMGLGDVNERLTFTSVGEFYDLRAGTTDTLVIREQRPVLLTPNFPPPVGH